MSATLHISSLIAFHREQAEPALDAQLAAWPEFELVARQSGRSVLLCESGSEHELLQRIEQLQCIEGVVAVNLVYHHAEPRHPTNEEDPA